MISLILLNYKRLTKVFISFTLLFFTIITFISLSLSAVKGYSTYFSQNNDSYYQSNYVEILTEEINDKVIIDEILNEVNHKTIEQKNYSDLNIKTISSSIISRTLDSNVKAKISSYDSNQPKNLSSYYEKNNPLDIGRFPEKDNEIVISNNLLSYLKVTTSDASRYLNYTVSLIDENDNNNSLIDYKIVGVFNSNYQHLNYEADALIYVNSSYYNNKILDIKNYVFLEDFQDNEKVNELLSSYKLKKGYGYRRYLKLLSIQEFINDVLLIIFIPVSVGLIFLFIYSFRNIYLKETRIISIQLTSGIEYKKIITSFVLQILIVMTISLILSMISSSLLLLLITNILSRFEIPLIFNYGFNILYNLLIYLLAIIILIGFIIYLVKKLKNSHIQKLLKD